MGKPAFYGIILKDDYYLKEKEKCEERKDFFVQNRYEKRT